MLIVCHIYTNSFSPGTTSREGLKFYALESEILHAQSCCIVRTQDMGELGRKRRFSHIALRMPYLRRHHTHDNLLDTHSRAAGLS